jgi:hypothetical protein
MTPELLKQYIDVVCPFLWITIVIYNVSKPANSAVRAIITWERPKKEK